MTNTHTHTLTHTACCPRPEGSEASPEEPPSPCRSLLGEGGRGDPRSTSPSPLAGYLSPPPKATSCPFKSRPGRRGACRGDCEGVVGRGLIPRPGLTGPRFAATCPRPANHGASPACVARLRPRVGLELSAPLFPPGLSPLAALALPVSCRGALDFCFDKMAAALLLLRRRRRLRALGRRRRPLSLTERRGAGTRGAMAGGRRGAIARPE